MSKIDDAQTARTARIAAIVIAIAGLLSIFAPAITRTFGLAPRVEMLFYFAALGAFIWSLVVTWKLWQKRNNK